MNKKQRVKARSIRFLPLWEGRPLLQGTGFLVTLIAAALVIFPPDLIRLLDCRVYDLVMAARKTAPGNRVPVIVAIDEKSLAEFGQWPWPRYRIASLVDKLKELGAEAIALDMVMPEPDRTSPEVILRERRRDLQETLPDFRTDAETGQNDRVLARSLRSAPCVLGFKAEFTGERPAVPTIPVPPLTHIVLQQDPGVRDIFLSPLNYVANLPLLTEAAVASGFTNALHDRDGSLRSIPLLLRDGDRFYPSLALAAVLLAAEDNALRLTLKPAEAILEWRGLPIPLDRQGNMLIDFQGPAGTFDRISAADILSDLLPPERLRGRIVFVGAWAAGLGDRHVTPLDKSMPGLEVHANIAENLLSGTFLSRPEWARGAELFIVCFLGLLATCVLSRSGFVLSLILLLGGSLAAIWGMVYLFEARGLYVSTVVPVIVLLANTLLLGLAKYGIEARKVYQRTLDLAQAQDATIISMTSLAEARDEETGGHILRTQLYVKTLAEYFHLTPQSRRSVAEEDIELLAKSAPLHDIGKVGIPDRILQKPGKLTDSEFEIMKTHTLIGAHTLAKTIDAVKRPNALAFLEFSRQMAESHHEKWDGTGYPYGLTGEEIPLAGRLMALADVYDALISKRIYKEALSQDETMDIILKRKGKHFDPEVVEAFIQCRKQFLQIAKKFRDEEPSPLDDSAEKPE